MLDGGRSGRATPRWWVSVRSWPRRSTRRLDRARIERFGIKYAEDRRARIEAICFRRELAFVARLSESAKLQEDIAQYLNWCQGNPDYFSDAHFLERYSDGEVGMLRHVGVPDRLIRAMLT